MKETIGAKIYELVSPLVQTFNAEAEADTYPYAVYMSDLSYRLTKDGVDAIRSDLTLDIYSKNFDECEALCASIMTSLDGLNAGSDYSSRRVSLSKDCTTGVWDFTLKYRINQNK